MLDFARSKGRYLLMQGYPRDREVPYSVMVRCLAVIQRTLPGLRVPPWAADELATLHPVRFPTEPGGGRPVWVWGALG